MTFIWSKTAREEYRDAIRWYEDASQGLGERFSRLLGDVLGQIAEKSQPLSFLTAWGQACAYQKVPILRSLC